VYFSRFYRLRPDAAAPPLVGPTAADLGYLKYAIFLGDNDAFSITYAIESDDEELRRRILDPDGFETVARSIDAVAPWRAEGIAEPITHVHVMAGLRNRYRPLVVDETPLVHGFVTVGDASVCTNPLYGRGCSLAFVHAYGLADALTEHGDNLDSLARTFAAFTEREMVPWFRSAVMQDAQARALLETDVPSEDPRAFMQSVFREGLLPAMRTSPVVFRAFLRWFNLLVTPEALMADANVVNAVLAAYNDRENNPPPPILGPARDEMVSLLT
jgi:2-polyprenyl-6-methoxyphenol hydroxylase-like FAD-dependent oxidoreductase